jgi:DNA invertase Pin-like site-specific DNA recombinase
MARKSRKNIEIVTAEPAAPHVFSAAAYVRLSSDDRRKRGDSLETQRNIIENFIAASPDIRLAEGYSDNDKTGTNFDRPGFRRMLSDIEAGKIDCIVVKDLTRFGRSSIDAGYYIEKYLPAIGVRFIAVTDNFDSAEGDGGIIVPLKSIIAESYALDISRKCKAVQRQNIKDGRFVGRMAPYGYAKSPEDCHRLAIDPESAAVVRQIFAWAKVGINANEIVRRLNEEGIPTPSRYKYAKGLFASEKLIGSEHWTTRTIDTILCDRVYAGDMVQGKTRTVNYKQLLTSENEWICVRDTHEPIVSRDMFDKVQAVIAEIFECDKETRRKLAPYSENVFKGKIICAKCGHPMHRHRQNKDGTYWFRCQSQWKRKKDTCVLVSVKESELKTEVLTLLHKHSEALLGRFIAIENERQDETSADTELRKINSDLDKSGRMLRSLYEDMVGGLITAGEFTQMKSDCEAKIVALSARADELRDAKHKIAAVAEEYRDITEAVSAALADDKLTGEIIGRLVDKILVSPDKSFEILFRFGDEFADTVSGLAKAPVCEGGRTA